MTEFLHTLGDDTFVGTSGQDFFVDLESGGRDNIDGEGGIDQFYTEVYNSHVIVDLNYDSGAMLDLDVDPFLPNILFDIGDDARARYNFVSVEQIVIVNFDGRTILHGDSRDNFLSSELGRAVLSGGGGNDRLSAYGADVEFDGGPGDDIITAQDPSSSGAFSVRGGTGFDTFKMESSRQVAFTVTSLEDRLLIEFENNQITLFDDVERVEFYSPYPTIVMTYAELEAMAAPPVNEIVGDDGNNTLIGTDADDLIRGLGGEDIIHGSLGADTLDGGASNADFVNYSDLEFPLNSSGLRSLAVDLTIAPYKMAYQVGGDIQRLFGIEGITGTRSDDYFRGTVGPDLQFGLAGSDTFYASLGADRYFGGGGGRDRLNIASTDDGSVTQLSLLSGAGFSGLAEGDRYHDIEWVYGHGASPFDIVGDHGSNFLTSGEGDDTITGFAGNDVIDGGGGEDIAVFDYFYDEARIDYRSLLDPTLNGKLVTYIGSGSTDGQDKTANIETLQFLDGQLDVDTMVFTQQAVQVDGTSRTDRLSGTRVEDLIRGFAGDDLIFASEGADKIDGGAGTDSLVAGVGSDIGVHLSLLAGRGWTGAVAGDRLESIENVTTYAGDDTLTGSYGDNYIKSGSGDDVVAGLGGNDIIDTGAGFDTVLFAFDRDQYEITSRNGATYVDDISWSVRYNGIGSGDGNNIVTHAEILQFADGDFIL